MPRFLLALAALATVGVAGVAAERAPGAGSVAFCRGPQLTGRFAVIPGSAGAGNIVYRLTLRNQSTSACAVTGLPRAQLLGKTGRPLPTHVIAARPGALTAVLVTLQPRQSARATARFSPDVPGVGDREPGPCQPKAYRVRILARGGGSSTVPIQPATPVCERGQLQFSAYGR